MLNVNILVQLYLLIWLIYVDRYIKRVLEGNTQQWATSLRLGSLWRNAAMINPISFVVLWTCRGHNYHPIKTCSDSKFSMGPLEV